MLTQPPVGETGARTCFPLNTNIKLRGEKASRSDSRMATSWETVEVHANGLKDMLEMNMRPGATWGLLGEFCGVCRLVGRACLNTLHAS